VNEKQRRQEFLSMASSDNDMLADIHADNNDANHFASLYFDAVLLQLIAHVGILSVSMVKFKEFLDLKELPKLYENCINLAFTAVSVAAPELFLVKFLGEQEETVKAALALSAALGNKTAKALSAVQRVHEAAEPVHGAVEKGLQVKERIGQLTEGDTTSGMAKFSRLDAGMAAVNAMMEQGEKAYGVYQKALDVLSKEYRRRLKDPKPLGKEKESLLQLANRLLPHPGKLTADDIAQIQAKYLYEMIHEYVKQFVTLKVDIVVESSIDGPPRRREEWSIEKLNDNQENTIVEYFSRAPRGKIFYAPPIFNIYLQIKMWGAKEDGNVYYSGPGGFRAGGGVVPRSALPPGNRDGLR
jgi:hypothetical protein